jgi:hypothetical protein
MLIYNITTLVDHSIAGPWSEWMLEEHIPRVMRYDCFLRFQFVRLLDTDESQGLTFAVQYFAADRNACDHYSDHVAPILEQDSNKIWGEKTLSFRTLMLVVK